MKVTNKINGSKYEYPVKFQKDLFCPNCAKEEVYIDVNEGDVYEGSSCFCKNCKCTFTMPTCWVDKSIEFVN